MCRADFAIACESKAHEISYAFILQKDLIVLLLTCDKCNIVEKREQ